jgi:hypothetical protein
MYGGGCSTQPTGSAHFGRSSFPKDKCDLYSWHPPGNDWNLLLGQNMLHTQVAAQEGHAAMERQCRCLGGRNDKHQSQSSGTALKQTTTGRSIHPGGAAPGISRSPSIRSAVDILKVENCSTVQQLILLFHPQYLRLTHRHLSELPRINVAVNLVVSSVPRHVPQTRSLQAG